MAMPVLLRMLCAVVTWYDRIRRFLGRHVLFVTLPQKGVKEVYARILTPFCTYASGLASTYTHVSVVGSPVNRARSVSARDEKASVVRAIYVKWIIAITLALLRGTTTACCWLLSFVLAYLKRQRRGPTRVSIRLLAKKDSRISYSTQRCFYRKRACSDPPASYLSDYLQKKDSRISNNTRRCFLL